MKKYIILYLTLIPVLLLSFLLLSCLTPQEAPVTEAETISTTAVETTALPETTSEETTSTEETTSVETTVLEEDINLAPNPSFEEGAEQPDDWEGLRGTFEYSTGQGDSETVSYRGDFIYDNSTAYDGSYSVAIKNLGGGHALDWITKDYIEVDPELEYKASVWVKEESDWFTDSYKGISEKTKKPFDMNAFITIMPFDASENSIPHPRFVSWFSLNPDENWKEISGNIKLPPGTVKVKIHLEAWEQTGYLKNNCTWFDNVYFGIQNKETSGKEATGIIQTIYEITFPQDLSIDSSNKTGVKLIIPEQGRYKFSIIEGAYTIYEKEQNRGWSTLISLFINKSIKYKDTEYGPYPFNEDATLGLGDLKSTYEAAENTAKESSLIRNLNQDDYVILIIPDSYYEDNSGSIQVRIERVD